MQVVDANGNVYGQGLQITDKNGKPKIPVINTDITIGTTVITGGVSGRLLYDNAGKVGEINNISWNSSTNILTLNSDVDYTTYNRTIASSSYPLGTLFTSTIRSVSQINHSGGTNGLTIGGGGGSPLFRIFDTGNTVIQTGGTYVDAGFKFDVIGSVRVTSLKTADIFPASATISLWTNSLNATSRFYTTPVHQDGRINFNAIAGGSDQVLIRAWHTGSFALGTGSSAAGGALTVRGDSLLIGTSGSLYIMAGTFGPVNVPYRLGITTNATTTGFHTGVVNNLTNIESAKFEYTAISHTFYTGTTTGNQGNPNQYTPLTLSNLGNVGIGTITLGTATKLTIGGTQTASSAIARGDLINITLAAAANNDVLVGLDIAPTYTNGAFTGLTNVDLRTKSIGLVIGSGVGYGALYGYNNDGVLQVVDGGTSALSGYGYATQLWLRPSGNASGLNSNYWATIEQSTGGLFIQSGRYNSNIFIKTGRAGTSGNIYLNNAGATMAMFFGATGNFAVNSTLDAGFKFDCNGTARFTGAIIGPNNSSLNSIIFDGGGTRRIRPEVNSLDITDPSGNIGFRVDSSGVRVASGFSSLDFVRGLNSMVHTTSTIQKMTFTLSGQQVNHLTPFVDIVAAGYAPSAPSGNNTTLRIFTTNTTSGIYGNIIISHNGTSKTGNILIGTSTNVASAIVNVESTTQGLLFPRMSTTEKLAIVTPTAGLVIFDTTLNKLCVYTTAWETITSA